MGDFNEVRHPDERSGGASCNGSIREFREWSDSLRIDDIPLKGRSFTWARGMSRSRLDRMFFDQEWSFKFPGASLTALPNSVSDHAPIHLVLEKHEVFFRPFRNLDTWFSHPGFIKLVREEWKKLGEIPATRKLRALHAPIRRWNKIHFGNIDAKIALLEKEQLKIHTKIDRGISDPCDWARLEAVEACLRKWLDRKMSYWKQISKDRWIKEGDRNTKYFHAVAVGKRRLNRIDQIKRGNRIFKKPQAIKIEILNFFKSLYSQKSLPRIHIEESILPKISLEQRLLLEKKPSQMEIWEALQNCDSAKAPGYDGFNFRFVKEMWQDIGQEMSELIHDFFDTGRLPSEINHTWVTLIPKVEGAVEVKDFRPISMIGSIYKIIAKILASRLSKVLPDLIGETQSAFVKNRRILDSALIANEVVWWLKKTHQETAILKLDFQKAYDTIRWDFLEETLHGMGFGEKWSGWIMECVRTASMSILINGSPTSPFNLQRGLRQGDPLSPFLFLLVGETFNRLVLKGVEIGVFKGVYIGRKQIRITHLQFADDTIIFSPADTDTLHNYKRFLRCFELMTGLKINYGKTTLTPLNCKDEWVETMQSSLNCAVANLPIKYLGIPLGANPRRAQTWKPIIEKVERRLALWKARSLSRAGRLVLIKAVLHNLPLYYLSIFRMPKKVAERIIQLQRSFFWGKKDGDRGGNLISWKVIQKPMVQGGLGVGDIFIKNASLLFKWWWRYADEQKPLWKEIINSNHDHNYSGRPRTTSHARTSSLWYQIANFENFSRETQEVARKGIRVKVGNGAQARFWMDFWVGEDSLMVMFPRLFGLSTQKEEVVANFGEWERGEWTWKFQWRRKLFSWEEDLVGDLLHVLNRWRMRERSRDVRVWAFDNASSFLVSKFILQVNRQMESRDLSVEDGRLAWRKIAPPRAQLHLWFLLHGRINTKERLFRHGAQGIGDDRCVLCKDESETIDHLFFKCRFSSSLWYYCCHQWNFSYCLPNQAKASLISWNGAPFVKFDRKIWMSLFYVITWSIWNIRNKVVFQGLTPNWDFEKRKLFLQLGLWTRGWCHDFPFSPEQVLEKLKDLRRWSGKDNTHSSNGWGNGLQV